MTLDPEFLAILACPLCKAPLELARWKDESAEEALRCGECRRVYPVRQGIPELLLEEAWTPAG